MLRIPTRLADDSIPEAVRAAGHWFLDLLHRRFTGWRFDPAGFVRLKYDYLTTIIPRKAWPPLRTHIERLGIVECDHRAVNGVKAFGYRLRKPYISTRRIECMDAGIIARVLKRRSQARARLLPVHRWLEAQLYRVQFDLRRALDITATLAPDSDCPLTTGEYQEIIGEQCRRIGDRERHLSVDPYGRVHTPITSLPKALRCCLSFDGEPLVGLDLANSQPLFAGLVAYAAADRKTRYRMQIREFSEPVRYDTLRLRQRKDLEGMGTTRREHQTEEEAGRKHPPTTTARETVTAENSGVYESANLSHLVDLGHYLALCESGELYESLMEDGDTRDEIKRRLFVLFYGKPNWKSPLSARFAAQFPTVDATLRALKRHDYQRAAWLMQHAESSLFIGAACGRIMRERPTVPILTIHDSLLTTPEHVGYVESVIRSEFDRLGVRPTLHREECAKDAGTTPIESSAARKNIRSPSGGRWNEAVTLARLSPAPPEAARLGYSAWIERLLVLCWALQQTSGDKPFPLGCRKAADGLKACGFPCMPRTASGGLETLCEDGVLVCTYRASPGTRSKRESEYRYVLGQSIEKWPSSNFAPERRNSTSLRAAMRELIQQRGLN